MQGLKYIYMNGLNLSTVRELNDLEVKISNKTQPMIHQNSFMIDRF